MPPMPLEAALIPIVCIGLLLWKAFTRRPARARAVARTAFVLLALASFALAYGGALREAVTKPYGKTDAWGVFHYYLGAKYFSELDYTSFYACVLAADLDGARVWDARAKVRDLSTYAIVGRDDIAPCPRDRFSPPRWSAFVKDVTALQSMLPESERAAVLTDKGFNPPPSWSVLAGWVANHVPLDHARAAKAMFNVDLAFTLIALIALAVAVDIETASVAAIFVFLYFGSVGRLTGNFLQYAWFPALTGAVLAWRSDRYRQSAFWWALATLAQTFPLALTSAIGLRYLWLWKERKRGDAVGHYGRFIAHYATWLVAGIAVGCLSGRGPRAWWEWVQKITVHGAYLVGEVFDIGLRNLIATAASSGTNSAHSYLEDYPNVMGRLAAFKSYEWIWYLVAIGALVGVLARMKHVTHRGVLGLGFVMMYVLLDLAPYYYASLAVLFAVFPLNEGRKGLVVHGGLLLLNAYHAVRMSTGYVTFDWSEHLVSEIMIAGLMLALLVMATRGRPVEGSGMPDGVAKEARTQSSAERRPGRQRTGRRARRGTGPDRRRTGAGGP